MEQLTEEVAKDVAALSLIHIYCVNKPEIPDVAMSFSKPDVKAYVDGNVQRTENIQFNASSQQKITMDLPKGVKLHNVSTGNVSAAGASVTIGRCV